MTQNQDSFSNFDEGLGPGETPDVKREKLQALLARLDAARARGDYESIVDKKTGRPATRGDVYAWFQEYDLAQKEWAAELAAARRAGDAPTVCELLIKTGSYFVKTRQEQEGRRSLEEALRLAEERRMWALAGQAHLELSGLAFAHNDVKLAISHMEQTAALAERSGDKRMQEQALGNLGAFTCKSGNVRQGLQWLEEARTIAHQIGEKIDEANHCQNLGMVYMSVVYDASRALEAYEAAQALYIELNLGPEARLAGLINELRAFVSGRK